MSIEEKIRVWENLAFVYGISKNVFMKEKLYFLTYFLKREILDKHDRGIISADSGVRAGHLIKYYLGE